jgi:YD repeat-containing protein
MNLRREARYDYNGQNRMVYSEVTSHVEKNRATSRYVYDALGRRTVSQDAGGSPMRTLYDAFSFEVIREGKPLPTGALRPDTVKGYNGKTTPGPKEAATGG